MELEEERKWESETREMCCEMLSSGHGMDIMKSYTHEFTAGWISAQDQMSWTSSLGSSVYYRTLSNGWLLGKEQLYVFMVVSTDRILVLQWITIHICIYSQQYLKFEGYKNRKVRKGKCVERDLMDWRVRNEG